MTTTSAEVVNWLKNHHKNLAPSQADIKKTDPESSVYSFLVKYKDDSIIVLGANGRVHFSATSQDCVCNLPQLLSYAKSKGLKRALKLKESNFDIATLYPYILPHKTDPKKVYCMVTRTELNFDKAEIESHMNGGKFLLQRIKHEKKRREKIEKAKIAKEDAINSAALIAIGDVGEEDEMADRIPGQDYSYLNEQPQKRSRSDDDDNDDNVNDDIEDDEEDDEDNDDVFDDNDIDDEIEKLTSYGNESEDEIEPENEEVDMPIVKKTQSNHKSMMKLPQKDEPKSKKVKFEYPKKVQQPKTQQPKVEQFKTEKAKEQTPVSTDVDSKPKAKPSRRIIPASKKRKEEAAEEAKNNIVTKGMKGKKWTTFARPSGPVEKPPVVVSNNQKKQQKKKRNPGYIDPAYAPPKSKKQKRK